MKVPLFIRPPGNSGGPRSIDAPISLVSLTPTLLDGLEIDSGLSFQAQSLLPLMTAGGDGEDVIAEPIQLTDEQLEQFKSLGYVGN